MSGYDERRVHVHELGFPEKELSMLRATDDVSIARQLVKANDVADIYLAKLSDISLQLETRESVCH